MTFPVPAGPPFDIGDTGGAHAIPPALQPTGPSAGQVEAWRAQLNEMVLSKVTLAMTGFFIPDPVKPTAFEQLQAWANANGLGGLLGILTGLPAATQNDVANWVNTLLGINRPVPEIQAAAVVDTNPNLLLAPNFPTAGTFPAGAGQNWSWTNSVGHDSIGAAQVVAAGYISELVSNQIAVTEKQKLDLSVWVKWSGLSYTGTNPISMGVTHYLNFTEVDNDDLAFFATPTGTQDWTQLAYSGYEIPADVDEIRLRFKIDTNLTAGTVYWDDAVVIKTQPGSGYTGSFLDTIVNGLENVNQPGWDFNDLLISFLNLFRTTANNSARITLLENLQSTGNKINDEFLRVGSTLGGDWSQFYIGSGAGTWETDGDYAFWRDSGVGELDVRCRYIGSPSVTLTDTQKITAILGSKGEVGFLPSILGLLFICDSHFDLYGRMNTTGTEGTDWIRARFSSTGHVYIQRNLAGVITELGHTTNYDPIFNPTGNKPPGAGSSLDLVCGTGSGARFFEARINGITVCTANDSTSSLGANYRGYGHGARAEGSILIFGQTTPPSLNAWAAVDN